MIKQWSGIDKLILVLCVSAGSLTVCLTALCSYVLQLSPPDSEMVEAHKKELMEAKAYARKQNVVSLADKSADSNKNSKPPTPQFVSIQPSNAQCEAVTVKSE